jgi:peptidoglycan/xylan/chitin deacetylase (PgdA/CDA1 family)
MIGKRSIAIAFGVTAVLLLPLAGGVALAAPPKKQPAPTVVATTPSNGATGVPVNVAPTATFDVRIATSPTVTLANAAGVAVQFDVIVSTTTLTITPRSQLANSTTYAASVKASNAIDGTQMSKPYKWTFTTGIVVRPVNNDCSAGTVEFTFDDGPTATTPSVISRLQALNLEGTFFVLGEEIAGNPAGQQTIRDEYQAGFSVQNHTYDHASFTGASTGTAPLTDAQIVQELDSASDAVVAAGVPKPTLYRPPYGDINAHADQVARDAGYRIVMPWSTETGNIIDSRDWTSGVTSSEIVRNVTVGYTDASGQFFPGMKADSIIAMHDADAIGTPKTVEALQGIVDYMNTNHFCSTSTIRPDATGGIVPPPPPPPPVYRPLDNDCSAGNVEFTFDDGPDVNTPAVLAALQGLNIKGVFFVLGEKVDASAANAQIVQDEITQGHTVGNHSYDHASFNGASTGTAHLTDAQITDELTRTAASLTNLGLPLPTLYRPPYGDIDAYTDNLARSLGYRIVMPWALGANTGTRIVDSKDWSGISPQQIASNVVNGFTDANGFHPGINANSIISMHDGETNTTLNTVAALQLIVDYMNANHYCATSTIPDDATGAVVPLPAPPEPDTGNLVQNASLETVPAGATEPSCFQQGGASIAGNTATWSATSDAHSGAIAERVDVTQWTSGDRKLIIGQRPSQSSCIAPLTSGQSVRAWVWYKGSWAGYGSPSDKTKVSMAIYYRDSGGVFRYWMSSPLQPPSANWNLASVKTPPLQAGATGVSFGLAIQGVGTLITDDYALAVQ